ncbi:MAG TPA: phage tail protein [Candidatus Limnocylindrales bacterium]|nr:phage tail protein [Candidatus Limnocylindrales bacterium]
MPKGLPNLPTDALAAYTFAIEIDRTEIAQFSEVSGIASEVDVIEIKENNPLGQPNLKKVPGWTKSPTITLKRAKNASQDLWKWHEAIMQGKLGDARRNGSVIMKSFDGTEVARYNFTNGWVSKISASTLKAGSNEVLMEEVSIVTESLERVL